MRVLLAHNYYGSAAPSGENQVFETERDLLRRRGHEVLEFTQHSDILREKGAWGAFRGGFFTPWNPFSAAMVKREVAQSRPDIVHAHNTFPLISPSVFHAVGQKTTKILTLHNYRLFCPAAIPMRDGKTCTKCLDRHSVLSALRHGCYRGSRLATFPLAAGVALHRLLRTWGKHVDAFIALTGFQRDLMVEAGLPADRVFVKPNFHPKKCNPVPWEKRQPTVVFAGRLTSEKGVAALVRAWQLWGTSAPELHIVGDGELRDELEMITSKAPGAPIQFLGQVDSCEAQEEIARASLLVLPSECYEGFPMVIAEAFACGTPVAVTNLGPLPSIVQNDLNGVVFNPHDPESLLETVRKVWETPGKLERLGAGARRSFDEFYNEEANYRMLMSIYEKALEINRRRRAAQ